MRMDLCPSVEGVLACVPFDRVTVRVGIVRSDVDGTADRVGLPCAQRAAKGPEAESGQDFAFGSSNVRWTCFCFLVFWWPGRCSLLFFLLAIPLARSTQIVPLGPLPMMTRTHSSNVQIRS